MPKLEGIESKTMFGYQVDKENNDVIYSDGPHVYLSKEDGSRYISVTTLIGEYENKFNEAFFSKYKALEALADPDHFSIVKQGLLNTQIWKPELISKLKIDETEFENKVQEILDEWHSTRDEACEHGTWVHSLAETSFYGKTDFDLSTFGCPNLVGKYSCKQGYYPKKLEDGIYPEYLVSWVSPEGLKISGQVDLLVRDGNDLFIFDYKGLDINTPILTTNGWKTMGTLNLTDVVFDKNGNKTKILHISEEHHNPCYKIVFDNGDELIADEDHRWLITFMRPQVKNKIRTIVRKEQVMTTKEIFNHIKNTKTRNTYNIPKIFNPSPLQYNDKELPIDPYVLGAWLGDGSKSCGIITNVQPNFWEEVKHRGYNISENLSKEDKAEMRTVYGLRTELSKLNLLNNKHIPFEYLTSSYKQRLDLLRGFMDTDGYYNDKRKRFVMGTTQEWQAKDLASLVSSLGWKPTIVNAKKTCDGKFFDGFDVCFTTNGINPFLIRNQENLKFPKTDCSTFRNIDKIIPIDTVITKCIEVDSPSHTYLAGKNLIITHNTNKEIKKKSYYNSSKKKNVMMKYPLSHLMDCNFYHYTLQLSLYAYMIQQINPELDVKSLKLIHIDREGKQTVYEVEYLKKEVETMIKHYAKQLKMSEALDRDKPYII